MMRTVAPLACLALLSPISAHAEGARMVLDCTGDAGAQTFAFDPVETDELGVGRVTVGDGATPGIAGGFFGPWSWTDDDTKYTLMVSGNDTGGFPVLLHTLDTSTDPFTSTLTELTCEAPS
ncbi:MAG: hypothetical protein VX874_25290 [Pseudomonadota bacterium]|nr:hypothetical protein [Pseudomonadota bacterium]